MSDYATHPAAELFPLLQDEELRELADDIAANGLHEPIWLYVDPELGNVVLDGRNRIAACRIAGVEPKTRLYAGDDPITFSISQNLKRRHLTNGQKAAVGTEAEPLYAAEAAKRVGGRPSNKPGADLPQVLDEPNKRAPRARDKAAKVAGTSGRAVAQFKRVKQQAPDLAEKVRAGDMALDRAERLVRDREAEQRRIEEAKREAAQADQQLRVDLKLGDFRSVLADLQSVDAIITDPPYERSFLPVLADLAAWSEKVLADDGVLAVLIGQSYLPEVYRLLDGHLDYRWTGCYITPGAGYVSHARHIQSNWKPVLVYGKGPRFSDVIQSSGDTGKQHHKWGQDFDAFRTLVERLTKHGQTVCDPFMGAGTTLLAAHSLGRHAVGCDVDQQHYETAVKRLS